MTKPKPNSWLHLFYVVMWSTRAQSIFKNSGNNPSWTTRSRTLRMQMYLWEALVANTSLNLHTMVSSITAEQLSAQSYLDPSKLQNKLLRLMSNNDMVVPRLDLQHHHLLKRNPSSRSTTMLLPMALMYMTYKSVSDPPFLLTQCRDRSAAMITRS